MSTTPLGRLDVSAVISRVFDTYAKTARVLLLGALVVFLPVALLTALTADSAAGIIAAIVSLVASVWYSGMVVKTVQDVQDGRVDASLGELFSSVTPVLGQLVVVGLLAGLGIGLGFLLLIVPGLILLTFWSVAAPVVVVEHPGAVKALGRSRALVRGHGWQVFGVIVVIFLSIIVVSIVIGAIGAISGSFVLSFLVNLALNVAVAPVYALAAAVLYFALCDADGLQPAEPPYPATGGSAGATDAFGRHGAPAPEAPGGWAPPAGAPPSSTPPPDAS